MGNTVRADPSLNKAARTRARSQIVRKSHGTKGENITIRDNPDVKTCGRGVIRRRGVQPTPTVRVGWAAGRAVGAESPDQVPSDGSGVGGASLNR